jgi:RNA polymerase-binding transcription factor DksA
VDSVAPDLIASKGNSDIVNLLESKHCCLCGSIISKRRQMWKFSDGSYMCISCKTKFESGNFNAAAEGEMN